MMYYVYVLRSLATGRRYIGQTSNLAKRLADHNSGASRYTSNRGPWVLVYKEKYISRSESIKRERFFKSGKGRELLDNLTK